MKLDLNKFYNTNYKDFVHKEAVEEALKRVPELELKDVEVENILSLTFSVDQHGENPMYIEYLDKEGKKHLVRIRPAVTEEITEILKNYETKEEHQADVEEIYNYFTRLNVPMEVRSQNSLDEEGNKNIIMNNDNAFISFQVDPEQDDAIQWLAIQNKNGALGDQYQYMARFVDFAKVDEVPSNADFAEKLQELEEKMNTADNTVLVTSKQYTDSNISSLANELNVKIEQTKNDLSILIDEKAEDTLQQAKEYADSKDTEYFETSKRYTDNAKQEAINESKTYTDTKHSEVTQQVTELGDNITPLTSKLSNIWGGHKATFIYWLPNIDVNTMKLENKENDVKVTLNDGDVVYWRKHEYQPVDLSNYYTKPESDEKFAPKTDIPTIIDTKVDNSITPTKINFRRDTNAVEVFNGDVGLLNGAFITPEQSNNIVSNTTNINNLTQTVQEIASKVDGIETTAPQPIEMSVSYNDNTLVLNNYSTYTTIGNTTIVNINCSFTAPFVSGTTAITNTLNISSETLKSFPTFMIDCIVNTSTNISSYTTTTVFPNNFVRFYVVTPIIPSNENIIMTSISLNGSFIFQQQ